MLGLLAAEMTAVTGRDPGELYRDLTDEFGDSPTSGSTPPPRPSRRRPCAALAGPGHASDARGRPDHRLLTKAPGNGAAIGGLKVVTENGWFAARPSGTEEVYKLYAESLAGATTCADPGRGAGDHRRALRDMP